MNEKGERTQRRLGLLALAALLVAGLACNAGAAQSSAPAAGGQAAPANVQGEVASDGGAEGQPPANVEGEVASGVTAEQSGSATSGSGGPIGLDSAQGDNGLAAEIDFGAGGAGGCEDPCGFCDESGNGSTVFEPVTEPQVLYTYQHGEDYLNLPFAYTSVCACGFPDEDVANVTVDPTGVESVSPMEVTFRQEADSFCAVADFDFGPGTLTGEHTVFFESPTGSVTTTIDVHPPEYYNRGRWFYDGRPVWFVGFTPNEPVEVYFWTIDNPEDYGGTARYLGMTAGAANELGEVLVNPLVDGIEANVIGVTAASGEGVSCRDGYGNECISMTETPLTEIIFLRASP